MIKALYIYILLVILPIPQMILVKLWNKRMTFASAYICGVITNLTLFSVVIQIMYDRLASPGLMPIKLVLCIVLIESIIDVCMVALACIKVKGGIGFNNLFQMSNIEFSNPFKKEHLFFFLAVVIWIIGSTSYILYVPNNSVPLMAEINRMDFWGITSGNPMVMLGYYIVKLLGISPANAVCVVIPLFIYFTYVIVMWEVSGALFIHDTFKRKICFFAEAVLVVIGDCLYSQPYIVLHGLNDVGSVMLVLCIPLVFVTGLHFYQDETCKWWEYCYIPVLCLIGTYPLEQKAFALVSLNIVIFGLLFVGRRYLPWLQSSKL